MGDALKTLIEICLFRKGPQHLPYAPGLLVVVIAISAGLSYVTAGNLPQAGPVTTQIAVAVLFGLFFLYALLTLRGVADRFIQSATAMFGADALIAAPVALVTFSLAGRSPEEAPTAALIILLLWLWHIGVLGAIFHHALQMRLPLGVLLALAYSFLSFQVVHLTL
ncbi:hypothetical protein CKO15_03330 [Halorhodospira abdelmalekii]|uniref:hypothetical protein n=1 Tax=Halorhodospira abdelmalekii TaxID=421629 RepID=UPI001907E7DB|nr:hypothetical protein [Halorhodospira abdelmalekii]MBK1734330.1 hypothetical protein [Halorhodospira abdelmalekii]